MSAACCQSPFTGLFRDFQRIACRPHDPDLPVFAGIVPPLHPEESSVLHVGGCGWSDDSATSACIGEAIERVFAYPTEQDAAVESSYQAWPLDEAAIEPERWVLFHRQQYARDNFPFEPLARDTRC